MMNAKRIFSVLLSVMLVFCICGCQQKVISSREKMVYDKESEVSVSHQDGPEQTVSGSGGYYLYKPASSGNNDTESANTNAIIHTGNFEKPYSGDASILSGEMHSPYDSVQAAMKKKIRNTKDTLKAAAGHNTFYVSYRGDDANSGFTKDSPFATMTAAYRMASSGDVVLLERGGVYRGNIVLKNSVSIGAYGTGEKPCIYGSLQNYADPKLWTKYQVDGKWKENVWRISVPSEQGMVGAVILDYGKATPDCVFKLDDVVKYGSDPSSGLAFCYKNHTLYMTCPQNPGSYYKDIEFCGEGHILDGLGSYKNITLENLCIKYGGEHGISFQSGARNITVRGCEVGFIGGCLLGGTIRYGNAIQFWGYCTDIKVQNCWTYQIFDTGITPQYQSPSSTSVMKNIIIDGNLVEYTNYGIEYFNQNGKTSNLTISNNMVRFSGYGLFPADKRIGGKSATKGGTATLQAWQHPCEMTNFKVTGNYFDTSARYLIAGKCVTLQEPTIPGERAEARDITIHSAGYPLVGNYYCLQTSAVYPVDVTLTPGSKPDAKGLFYAAVYGRNGSLSSENVTRCNSYEVMKSEVNMIDPNPKGIKFVSE